MSRFLSIFFIAHDNNTRSLDYQRDILTIIPEICCEYDRTFCGP